ncbi:unnamed protein product [Diabrotica balteata]|uniref:BTB domain-containing protein n=1 Tax=Diabrotica balteata TaxID=107213 RepID=A0A9N9STQ2_DIABA|nr:unnamed protein product [Diabrotica balteata]
MNSHFGDLHKALANEQSSKSIYKVLYNIRKEVEWPKNKENIKKIHEEGTIIYFINNLQSSHKHIVDLCLSILGNLFLDKNCAEDAFLKYEVLPVLIKVLKRYAKEDSIIGRSYKAIGNLCQQLNDCAITIVHESPIIIQLSEVLESFSNEAEGNNLYSEATITMAIRALRCFTNSSTARILTERYQILSAIGGVLIKLCNEWTQNKTHEKLLENIIDILYGFSKYNDYKVINELKNTKKGNAMEKLADLLTLNNKKIMKIIMNFIKISKLKSDLPVPEIVNKFVDEVFGKYIDPENGEFTTESFQYIDCLCFLFEHPANRNAYQCAKLIPLLIKILEKLNSFNSSTSVLHAASIHFRCSILIVHTLNKCKYEENLLQEQLKCNIIDILIKKLQLLTTEDFHTNHKIISRKKRSQELEDDQKESNGKRKKRLCMYCGEIYSMSRLHNCVLLPLRQYSPVSSGFSDDEPNNRSAFSRSPSPCSSSSSGLSWPSSNSRTSLNVDTSFSDSDYYSPVCSEDEDLEFPESFSMDCLEVLPGRFEKQEEDTFDQSSKEDTNGLEKRLILAITKLINSYVKLKPPVSQLGSEDLLLAIINVTEFCCIDDKIFNIDNLLVTVIAILHSHVYLLPLMKTSFIERISKLTEYIHSIDCEICFHFNLVAKAVLSGLTGIAESPVGKGNLAHELLRGSDEFRTQLVLSIIYVVENKPILFKLLLNCGGLNTIMSVLRGDSILYKNQSIKCISILACKRLKIKNPKSMAIKLGFDLKDPIKPSENPVNIVTFKLDDGICIKADRDYLTNKSDYFNRLLTGHFKESSEDEIYLHNVKSQTLKCLLKILTYKDIWYKADIDTLLDVIALSDEYLMNDLNCFVTNYVEKHRMNYITVPTIYRWSLESGLNFLRVESIAYALVVQIPDVDRFKMFDSLFALGYSDEVVDDIEKLLFRYLNSFQK